MRVFIFVVVFVYACSASASTLPDLLKSKPESWSILEASKLNRRIEEALKSGEPWAQSPLLLVLHLIGGDTDTRSLVIEEVKNRGEGADATTIVCIRDGFLDDSIRGDWYEFDLRRLSDGTWRVEKSKVALRCWRSENLDLYQGNPCP